MLQQATTNRHHIKCKKKKCKGKGNKRKSGIILLNHSEGTLKQLNFTPQSLNTKIYVLSKSFVPTIKMKEKYVTKIVVVVAVVVVVGSDMNWMWWVGSTK